MAEDFQAIIDAARDGVQPVEYSNDVLFVGTDSGKLLSLEKYRPAPIRKRGETSVFDATSFNVVVAEQAGSPIVTIYIDRDVNRPAIVAVLNGHTAGGPGWNDHRVALVLRPTPQWLKWRAIDGKLLGQTDFAEFIEDNGVDVVDPDGAVLLEIAQHLQVSRATSFRSAVRLSSGAFQFVHAEDQTAKVGAGEIAIPETIALGIAPFQSVAPFRIPARLRYRLTDGKLSLGIKLQRIEDVVSQALDEVVGGIEFSDTVVRVEGIAPATVA